METADFKLSHMCHLLVSKLLQHSHGSPSISSAHAEKVRREAHEIPGPQQNVPIGLKAEAVLISSSPCMAGRLYKRNDQYFHEPSEENQ